VNTTYNIVITGVESGIPVGNATRDLATLFKVSETQAEKIISSGKTIVKKSIPLQDAEKYKVAIEKCGAIVVLEPEKDLAFEFDLAAIPQAKPGINIIPENIRANLAKYEKHIKLTCLECGYVGLMGHVREEKKYRTPLVVISLIIILFFAVTNLVPSLYGYGFLTAYIPTWMKLGAGILIGVFIVKRSNILQCPNCEKELVQK